MGDAHDDDSAAFDAIDDPVVPDAQTEVTRRDTDQDFDAAARRWKRGARQDGCSVQELCANLSIKPF